MKNKIIIHNLIADTVKELCILRNPKQKLQMIGQSRDSNQILSRFQVKRAWISCAILVIACLHRW